jgi:phosphoesterase RecJ-like protein
MSVKEHTAVVEQIGQRLREARRVLIVSHIRPDGDAVGSTLGLGLALALAGKTVRMALADGVPANFRHLAGKEMVQRSPGEMSQWDTVIAVDCSDLQRTGEMLGERAPDINIDHHITNLNFAAINLVIPEQVATAAIIAEYLPAWGLRYNKAVAEALLTGIVTDTIGFRTSNMNPEALRLAAELMDHGASLPELYTRALITKTFEAARYWGFGLEKLRQEVVTAKRSNGNGSGECQLVWTTLTLEDRQAAQYPGNDDADLVNMLAAIEGDTALIFVEQKNGHVKVSWRARPGIDVSKIALQFGGGGHAAASGADIVGTLEGVREQVLTATRAALAQAMCNSAKNDEVGLK